MSTDYAIRRVEQPDGVDFLFERDDDAQIPENAEKLLLAVMWVIVFAMASSAIAVLAQLLAMYGILTGFPWWAVVGVGALIVGVLGIHRWVLGIDVGDIRVALRHHHLHVEAVELSLTEIEAIEPAGDRLELRTASRTVTLPAWDEALVDELRRAIATAQPGEPPEALRNLQGRARTEER